MTDTITNTLNYDGLFAGDFPVVTDVGTILSGENLARGTLVGKITATGKLKACAHDAVDGSQTPFGILLVATDASGGDKTNRTIALAGEFDGSKLTFGGTSTLADLKDLMRNVCLYAKTVSD